MRRTAPLAAIVGTIGVLLPLPACGSDAPAEATTQLSVTGADGLAFVPSEFAIPVGTEVSLELTTGEAVGHDFVVEGAANVGVAEDEGHGGEGHSVASGDLAVLHADPGQTATATFMMDEPGTYDIAASSPTVKLGWSPSSPLWRTAELRHWQFAAMDAQVVHRNVRHARVASRSRREGTHR